MSWWSWLWPKTGVNTGASDEVDIGEDEWMPAGRGRVKRYGPSYPDDYRIFDRHVPISGIGYRKNEALRFVNSDGLSIELEREPKSPHDPNAIKVIGISRRRRSFIGYIPRCVAAGIARSGMFDVLRPRLISIYEAPPSESDVKWGGPRLEITIQIVGPKAMKAQFQAATEERSTRKAKKAK